MFTHSKVKYTRYVGAEKKKIKREMKTKKEKEKNVEMKVVVHMK